MESEIMIPLEDIYKNREKCGIIHRLIPDDNGQLIPLSMDNCYINLTVVKHIDSEIDDDFGSLNELHEPKDKEEYGNIRESFKRPRSSEELNQEDGGRRILQFDDIFDNSDAVGISKRIFMLGRAGIGKTTLCKKIVNDYYAHGLWKQKFDRIIWLPLRLFKRQSILELERPSLADVYALQYFSSGNILENREMGERLVTENNRDESRVLYLLDGLDEIQNLVGNRQSPLSPLIDSLCGKPFVIVTSRPYTYYNNFKNFDLILETIGFSSENILDYVRVIFNDPSDFQKQKEIIEFIDKSPGNISGIATIPILLDIICYTWSDIKIVEENVQITMTRLYAILEKYLWGQFLIKTGKINSEDWRNTIRKKSEIYDLVSQYVDIYDLPKIAYRMLSDNKIEFTTQEAMREKEFGAKERILLKNTNFLHCLNPVDENIKEMLKSYVFIHLTIHEYLAAVYIANCLIQNDKQFDDAIYHKYNPRYSIVWSFVAGILADSKYEFGYKKDKSIVETFFNYLERDPVDELGIAHQNLILSCFNESSFPSILNEERENRLIDELYSYIFAQHVARGKSLFQQQLPVKVLKKIIGPGDENWGYGVSDLFKAKVLREQFLPEEIISVLLEDIGDKNSEQSEKILRLQNNLNLTAVNQISKNISCSIMSKETSKVNKYLEILRTKRFLPSDDETLNTITKMIDYAAEKKIDVKSQVLEICLNLREITFSVIERIVEKFSKRKRRRGMAEEKWKEEVLMGIFTDQISFPINKMMLLVHQKCFSNILEDFVTNKLTPVHANILYRLILVASNKRYMAAFVDQTLLDLCINTEILFDVRRMYLYGAGSLKILPDNVSKEFVRILEENNLNIQLNIKNDRRNLIFPSAPDHHVPEMNFTYLASLIPLMKIEFYERYRRKRQKLKFREPVYLSEKFYDLKFFYILSKTFATEIWQCIKKEGMYMRRDLHDELLGVWELLPANPPEWTNLFDFDPQRFLKNMGVIFETLFDNLENNSISNNLRKGKYFEIFFSHLLNEERSIDSQLYYHIMEKYRPLVVFAHHLYNHKEYEASKNCKPEEEDEFVIDYDFLDEIDSKVDCESTPDVVKEAVQNLECNEKKISDETLVDNTEPPKNWDFVKENFELICERVLLESLIVRAIRNCEISTELVSQLETKLCEQIIPQGNCRFVMNLMRILEFKNLQDNTVCRIIDFIETGNEYEVEVASDFLSRQSITDPVDIKKLKSLLLETNDSNVARRRKYRYVANIFDVNSRLLHSVQNDIVSQIGYMNFDINLKVLKILHYTQIKNEEILLKIPDIIKNMRDGDGDNPYYRGNMATCLDILLNQKKLPDSVLEKMAGYFEDEEAEYMRLYLGFLNFLRVPIPKKCIEGLYTAIDEGFVRDIRECGHNVTETENLMLRILRKQPLWNLLQSACPYKFKVRRDGKRTEEMYTIKDKVIVEKILQDKVPMAILKRNGKLCCFCPNSLGEYPLLEFGSVDITGILNRLLERSTLSLNLPAPLDSITRYLKFHTPDENLVYIRNLRDNGVDNENDNFFIKVRESDISTINGINCLAENFKLKEYRHIDLSGINLTDGDIVGETFLNLLHGKYNLNSKRLTTLILSDNHLTFDGLSALLRELEKFSVDYIFLDRNLIFLTISQFSMYIHSEYRTDNKVSEDDKKINVRQLDLSMNFISNGSLIVGDPFAEKEILPNEYMNDMKEFITNSPIIHSQDLSVVKSGGETKYNQMWSYCDFLCNPNPSTLKQITTEVGCIMIAEKKPKDIIGRWLFNRGHAFMAIEWIPDASYGQKQILLAHLSKRNGSRLNIEIIKISPLELKEKVEKCATCRTFSEPNLKIAQKLIPRLHNSKKQVDIFDYFIFSTKTDREKTGRYNCITWTDEMLKELGHNVDSMQKSKMRLYIILSGLAVLCATLVKLVTYYF